MPKVIIRPATRADIEAFSDLPNKPTVRAYVGEVDGKIVGMGGLARNKGRWIAFCDLTPEAREYKVTIVKTAKRIMEDAKKAGHRFVYAQPDLNEPNAVRWLTSLGFEPDQRSGGILYRWSLDKENG